MPSVTYLKDAAERVAATFAVAFLGVLTIALSGWLAKPAPLSWKTLLMSAASAGIIAAWDVLKVIVAHFVGDSESASLIR